MNSVNLMVWVKVREDARPPHPCLLQRTRRKSVSSEAQLIPILTLEGLSLYPTEKPVFLSAS